MTPRDVDQIMAKLMELSQSMGAVLAQVEGITATRRESDVAQAAKHLDHEGRIRDLETADAKSGRFTWGDFAKAVGVICSMVVAYKVVHPG